MDNCRECHAILTSDNWYSGHKKHHSYICKTCANNNRMKKYHQDKEILDNLKSNGCAICGYDRCPASLDFHHVNPEDKKFNITYAIFKRKNEIIADEITKCILLCKNCHYEIHHDEWKKYGRNRR